jgi:Protein of unknown function (DUF4199)
MENQTTTTRTALKWGVIFGIITVLYNTGVYVSGQFGNKALGYVVYLIIGLGVYFSLIDFKKENQGFMSFGQGLGLGTMMSTIMGLISSFYSFAYMKFIDSGLNEQMLKKIEQEMEKQGTPDDQIEKAMEVMKMFMNPGILFITGLLFVVFIGFVLSLIITAIIKKDKPVFD